jgi:hypothetical protein
VSAAVSADDRHVASVQLAERTGFAVDHITTWLHGVAKDGVVVALGARGGGGTRWALTAKGEEQLRRANFPGRIRTATPG